MVVVEPCRVVRLYFFAAATVLRQAQQPCDNFNLLLVGLSYHSSWRKMLAMKLQMQLRTDGLFLVQIIGF